MRRRYCNRIDIFVTSDALCRVPRLGQTTKYKKKVNRLSCKLKLAARDAEKAPVDMPQPLKQLADRTLAVGTAVSSGGGGRRWGDGGGCCWRRRRRWCWEASPRRDHWPGGIAGGHDARPRAILLHSRLSAAKGGQGGGSKGGRVEKCARVWSDIGINGSGKIR